MNELSGKAKVMSWVFQLIPAVILGLAGVGKLLGSEVDIIIFEQLEIEGTRIVIGIVEVIAAILLVSKVPQYGALLGFGTMIGAIIAHVSALGLEVQGDGGLHILMLVLVFVSTSIVMWIRRRKLPFVGHTCRID